MSFKNLVKWSLGQFSGLPWRQERTLYSTLVSEIMLQQTTVPTVLNHFERFIKKYPSPQKLAMASEEQLTIDWKGLGYYRRARNLRKACITITSKFNGEIPLNYDDLVSIDGIGEYTANAILSIGANQAFLALDANLERVLARYYGIEAEKGKPLKDEIKKGFKQKSILKNISRLNPRDVNEALMDLGRDICQARKASCLICPLNKSCHAFKTNSALEYPKIDLEKEKKKAKLIPLSLLRVVVRKNQKVLAYKKDDKEWLSGQWEIPTFILATDDKKLTQYPLYKSKKLDIKKLKTYQTGITKYKITNYVLPLEENEFAKKFKTFGRKVLYKSENASNSNLTTASIKALKKL